jgi:hypothetical protein
MEVTGQNQLNPRDQKNQASGGHESLEVINRRQPMVF